MSRQMTVFTPTTAAAALQSHYSPIAIYDHRLLTSHLADSDGMLAHVPRK